MSMVSTICTGIRLACETARVVHSADRMMRSLDENEGMIRTASVGNRVFMLCMNAAEFLAIYKGAPPETLSKIKAGELIGRALDCGIRPIEAAHDHRTGIDLVEEGVIAPFISLFRTGNDLTIYASECYLRMSPEELAKHPISIYEQQGEDRIKVGERPRTVEGLKSELEAARVKDRSFKVMEAAFNVGCATKIARPTAQGIRETFNTTHQIYETLMRRMQVRGGGENPADPFAFRAMSGIPDVFHDDLVLRRYICPISLSPIRHAVGDPNGETVYERAAIEQWIHQNGTSPVTRQRLTLADLRPVPAVQAFIDNRLEHLEQRMRQYAGHIAQDAPDPVLQAAAVAERPNL